MAFTDKGTKQVNNISATHILLNIAIKNTASNATTAGTQDLYFTTGYASVLQVENPGNVQFTPISVAILPATATNGISGSSATFYKSNGETETDTGSLDSASNDQAKQTYHVTTRDATNAIIDQETNAITIYMMGVVFAITSRLSDPSGAVLTLSGNKQ